MALLTLSLESSVTGRRPSATQEAGEHEAASEKAVTEEVNMAEIVKEAFMTNSFTITVYRARSEFVVLCCAKAPGLNRS